MKILLIDKNLVDPVNYLKWQLLAKKPGIKLFAVTPDRWIENYRLLHPPMDKDFGFPVTSLKVFWPGYENRGFYLWGLGKVIRSIKPDVIISFEEPFSIFALQTWIAVKRCGSNAKIVLHSWDNLSYGEKYPYRPSPFYRFIERWVMPRVDLLITANQEAADWRLKKFKTPIRKIYFGVDTKTFSSNKKGGVAVKGINNVFYVGYIGRILIDKGLETLIDAISMLPEMVHLILVGNGRDRDYIMNKINQLRLNHRVKLYSAVPSSKVPELFNKMDVSVLPSKTLPLWKEQYGRVLVESMACGVPPIGSSSGAIPDVIGNAGLIFPENDARALADCINRMKNDPILYQQFVFAGKERANLFSAENFADRMYELIVQMANLQ